MKWPFVRRSRYEALERALMGEIFLRMSKEALSDFGLEPRPLHCDCPDCVADRRACFTVIEGGKRDN